MRALFSRYGRIVGFDVSSRVKCDEVYIDFHQREDAFKALEMNKVKMCGRRLRVALNCRKPANRQGYTVIVEMPERTYPAPTPTVKLLIATFLQPSPSAICTTRLRVVVRLSLSGTTIKRP
uniref:(northern house mosquito) hypothetical protein n=1 Tax=Culex pipiens TaxID=7175 RepID=A0A8D8CMM6_CULPI